jgi:anti-sigma regulatory factor (Ser/Thr protein kinase)
MPYYRCAACGLTSYSATAYFSAMACASCGAPLEAGDRLDVRPGESNGVDCVVASRPEAIASARRTVVGLPFPGITRETLALLVSELVTNSVLHAGVDPDSPVRLSISRDGDRVRVAVHDGGPGFLRPPADLPDPAETGGRGFAIVAALSDAWGVEADGDGCTVWCEVVDPG